MSPGRGAREVTQWDDFTEPLSVQEKFVFLRADFSLCLYTLSRSELISFCFVMNVESHVLKMEKSNLPGDFEFFAMGFL